MRIGITGIEFVGKTTAEIFRGNHELILYDKYEENLNKFPEKLIEAEVIFICVPTPMKTSEEIDYSAIHNSLELLEDITKNKKNKSLVAIRLTSENNFKS